MLPKPTHTLWLKLRPKAMAVLLVAAILTSPVGVGAAIAAADGANTSAVAVNTRNGSSVFKLTFATRTVTSSVVDAQNVAVAFSSCTACQTVAISIEVLLVSGEVTTFTPTNEAIAINQNCDLCDTLALAYQFAVGVDARLKLTAAGRREIADIRHRLELLRNSGLTGPQIAAQVTALMGQLSSVLQTQLAGISDPGGGDGQASPSTGPATAASPAASGPTDTTTPSTSTSDTTPTTTTPGPSAPASTTTTPTTTASPATTPTPTTTTTPSTTNTATATTTPTTTTTATTPTSATSPPTSTP